MSEKRSVQNYYKILGVSRTADDTELRRAFAQKARVVHPDVSLNKEKARIKFMLLREAYDVLRDPTQRKLYDKLFDDKQKNVKTSTRSAPDPKTSEYYKEEWNMFVNQPEEYLGLFETITATASSGAKAVLSVVASTVFSIIASFLAVTIIAWLGMAIVSFASAITISSIFGLLIVIAAAANTIETISVKTEQLIEFFSSRIFFSVQKLPRIQAKKYINWIFAVLLLVCLGFAIWLNFAVYDALGYKHFLGTVFFERLKEVPLINSLAALIGYIIDVIFFVALNAPMAGSLYINTTIFFHVLKKIGKPKRISIKKPLQLEL